MGKPRNLKGLRLHAELSRYAKRTEGTETSKYLKENKSIEILLVAASERRTAQTDWLAIRGCRTGIMIYDGYKKCLGRHTIESESLVF